MRPVTIHLIGILIAGIPCNLVHGRIVYLDDASPTGIPDITQGGHAICAASAEANLLWEWSEHAPYDGSTGDPRLVDHPPKANPPQNWPATYGNWAFDAQVLRNDLATLIYQEWHHLGICQGWGHAGGTTRYLNSKNHLYNWRNNNDGISVQTYTGRKATYANLYSLLLDENDDPKWASVSTSWVWHLANGDWVENNGKKSRHALGAAGLDTANSSIYLTNGWGTHQNDPEPVRRAYYDLYTNIVTDGGGEGRFRIPAGAGAHNGGAGNNRLVRGIGNSATADYAEMYRFIVLKKGGSPIVTFDGVQHDGGSKNVYSYTIAAKSDDPSQEHFFLELRIPAADLDNIDLDVDVTCPLGWDVELWDPDGVIKNVTGVTGDGDGEELFGVEYAAEGSDDNIDWNPPWGGLHWYWKEPTEGPAIRPGEALSFSVAVSDSLPPSDNYENVGLTVVGEQDFEVLCSNMTAGPVPEPATLSLLVLGGLAMLTRRR